MLLHKATAFTQMICKHTAQNLTISYFAEITMVQITNSDLNHVDHVNAFTLNYSVKTALSFDLCRRRGSPWSYG